MFDASSAMTAGTETGGPTGVRKPRVEAEEKAEATPVERSAADIPGVRILTTASGAVIARRSSGFAIRKSKGWKRWSVVRGIGMRGRAGSSGTTGTAITATSGVGGIR